MWFIGLKFWWNWMSVIVSVLFVLVWILNLFVSVFIGCNWFWCRWWLVMIFC